MYGAPFGPDASDVWDWQQRAMEFVDALPVHRARFDMEEE